MTDDTDLGFARLLEDEPLDEEPTEPDPMRELIAEWANEHGAELARAAYLILRDDAEAGDCVQEAFIRAFRAVRRSADVRNPRAWLYRITTNIALNRIRKRERERRAVERLPLPEPYHSDGHDARVRRELVAEALETLPDRLRTLVVLRYYAGLTDREISEDVGIPVGTVKSRLAKAREHLARSSTLAEAMT